MVKVLACFIHKGLLVGGNSLIPFLFIHFHSRTPSCCGSHEPCKKSKHTAAHHCKYPYAKFFEMAWAITGYTDTVDVWGTIEETDLETQTTQNGARFGEMYTHGQFLLADFFAGFLVLLSFRKICFLLK